VLRAEADAEQLRSVADRDAQAAAERAAERDATAVIVAREWRVTGPATPARANCSATSTGAPTRPIGPLILDAEALVGEAGELAGLDHAAAEAARAGAGRH